ncbi:MAG: FAD binding domain-containing protein [Spirochaetota bacterium]
MVTTFHRPKDSAEALSLLAGAADRLALAGGTQLLSSESRGLGFSAVAVSAILPGEIDRLASGLSIGAAVTFQQLVDSPSLPASLRKAALGMVDRNIRNRATVGGNLGADKSCSSLIPPLLALDSSLELLDGRRLPLEDWLGLLPGPAGRGTVSRVLVPLRSGTKAGYARWSRVSCDIAILGAALAFRMEGGLVKGLRLVLGGVSAHSRRFPAIEALFEGRALPDRDAIEAAVAPLLSPIDDVRGSARFKRSRISGLVSEAFLEATEVTAMEATK